MFSSAEPSFDDWVAAHDFRLQDEDGAGDRRFIRHDGHSLILDSDGGAHYFSPLDKSLAKTGTADIDWLEINLPVVVDPDTQY